MHVLDERRRWRLPACARRTQVEWRRSRGSPSRWLRARCSACSGRTAPASRRRRDAHHDRRRRPPGRPGSPDTTCAAQPLLARGVSSVVFQDAVVDRGLSGRANLELHARLWGVPAGAGRPSDRGAGRRGRAGRADRPTRRELQRRRAAAARDRAGAGAPRPGSCSSMSRRSGSIPRIRHELLDVIAGLRAPRGADDPRHDALPRRGAAAVRPGRDHPPGDDRRRSTAPRRCSPGSAARSSSSASSGSAPAALAALRDRGIAGADAFAVGARVTVPAARARDDRGADRDRVRAPARVRDRDPAPQRSTTSTCN